MQHADQDALGAAQAERAGVEFQWYFGRVISIGAYEFAGGRGVTIAWEGGGVTSQQGEISDEQWEMFKLVVRPLVFDRVQSRVQSFEFHTGVSGGELPVHRHLCSVPVALPGSDFTC